jgi:hypothetical protein
VISYDNRSLAIAHDTMGTVTFSGHGGDSVLSGWDDVMPTAYEESFGLTTSPSVINGVAGDNLWRYDSPSFSGLTVHASYQAKEQGTVTTGSQGAYTDIGLQYAPEMLAGSTLGYVTGEVDEQAETHGFEVTGTDESTTRVKHNFVFDSASSFSFFLRSSSCFFLSSASSLSFLAFSSALLISASCSLASCSAFFWASSAALASAMAFSSSSWAAFCLASSSAFNRASYLAFYSASIWILCSSFLFLSASSLKA